MAIQELYIDSVEYHFYGRKVLNGVYLRCQTGEVLGLLGRNGSGKSTLLKMIFGALKPDYMHLKINGLILNRSYLTGKTAYLPQDYFIPGYLTVKTAVNLFANRYRNRLLAVDVIRENLHIPLYHLSGGNQRLIEVLLIIYSDAPFVLLDEPFSQLAPLIADEIRLHIEKFKAEKGFIITDHYYRQILAVADRMVLLHNGAAYPVKEEDDLKLHGYLPV